MSPDEDAVLVCLRVREDSITAVVAGSVQHNCAECDHRVWVAKAGQSVLARPGKTTVMCMECAAEKMKESPPERTEIAPGALEEMMEHLRGSRDFR